MRVFLTGATGFLGKAISGRLGADGHTVTALLLPNDDERLAEGCTVVRGNITRPETLAGKLEGHDAVVHLAGAVGYGQTWEACIALNRDGTENVAKESLRAGVRRFLHMSSVSVYGRVPDVPIHEDRPMKKIGDPYGDTKIDAERLLSRMAGEEGLELTMLRPTVIYGPGDTLFLPKVIQNLRSKTPRIIGTGENRVNLVHVEDAADLVSLVIRSSRSIGRVYNLTHPDNPTWKHVLTAVASVLDLSPPEKRIPYRVAMVLAGVMEGASFFTRKPPMLTRYAVRNVGRQYLYRIDRVQEELGFTPSRDTLEGVCACAREVVTR